MRIADIIISCSLGLMVVWGESVVTLTVEIAGPLTTGSNTRLRSSFWTASRRCSGFSWLASAGGWESARSSRPSSRGSWLGGRWPTPRQTGEAGPMGAVWLQCQAGGRV